MATSGSVNYTQNRNEVILDALIGLGVVRPGGTASSNDYTYMSNVLNKIVKALQSQGIHMWKASEGTLFLRDGVNKYTLGGASADKAGDNVVETELTASASGTSLTVTSTTGMTAADQIGIELDNNTRQWTTIVSVVNSTTVSITDSLTSVASSGNTVYSYTTAVSKPMMLYKNGVRVKDSNSTERPILLQGREEFMQIPNKNDEGPTNQVNYTPNIADGTMYVYPTPDNVADRVCFSYQKQIEDLDSSSDNFDFPTEWLECLTLLLMYRGAKPYGKDKKDRAELRQDAMEALMAMTLFDTDSGSSKIVPNYRDE